MDLTGYMRLFILIMFEQISMSFLFNGMGLQSVIFLKGIKSPVEYFSP